MWSLQLEEWCLGSEEWCAHNFTTRALEYNVLNDVLLLLNHTLTLVMRFTSLTLQGTVGLTEFSGYTCRIKTIVVAVVVYSLKKKKTCKHSCHFINPVNCGRWVLERGHAQMVADASTCGVGACEHFRFATRPASPHANQTPKVNNFSLTVLRSVNAALAHPGAALSGC